ncbi:MULTISPECIES: di-heme oxidoreductase family protein [Marinobacter]|uniref:di-heme oxidoreductase family protein n=1 Tax=Marinobacter TaxID=2742 RepID=UPI0007D9EF5F|nr:MULTISPECIES: di-heme oxidoredictase family protein [unclassified Marinobacter]MBL3825733.1 c-type cytochrome [Marinobacter sp. MC3]MBL3894330.1 c-type cytochrome [Marinobacter sp. MW3]OAN90027.1 thiol oxidoreductase [Marinobacter sp. EhN04]OAN97256.1 thiol oxidoreductase [Marinobacter sp. EhC06]
MMRQLALIGALAIASAHVTAQTHAGYPIQTSPATGGGGTVQQSDTNAYSLPQGNLSMTRRLDFSVGNSFFRNPWVEAPASTDARDGLGPLFNTNSCQGCHIKDGRGHPPGVDEPPVSLFLRLAVPADPERDAEILRKHGFKPAPVYGSQLQTAALPAAKPEADLIIEWTPVKKTLADGTVVELRKPVYRIENPNYGPLPEDLLVSPRVAPQMIGMGLLEAIPIEDLQALHDLDDADQNGISGKLNQVWDLATEQTLPGRFGWKAAEPDVHQQSMGAFAGDMGLTSTLKPTTDCMPEQHCERFTHGGDPEVSDKVANFVTFYAKSLAVPARRNLESESVQRGAELFNEIGCAGCHTPRHQTGEVADRPDLSNQTIWPYTDLLLHDMGPALADGRDEFLANGNEWRTPPLWGIGLAQVVNPQAGFLHDGRARTLEEAVLWHGGEAQAAADRYRQMSSEDRTALIDFLNSL